MSEEKKNGIVVKDEHNEFELALRFLGNELIAVKMAAHNFSGKLIVYSILLLLFSFMLIDNQIAVMICFGSFFRTKHGQLSQTKHGNTGPRTRQSETQEASE